LLNYILLALVYGGTLLYKRQHMTVCLDAAFPTHGNVTGEIEANLKFCSF